MLFNTSQFIFLYLPITLLFFFWIARRNIQLAAVWLAAASLFFYGYWNPKFILLLLASIGFNYAMGHAIGNAGLTDLDRSRRLLIFSVLCNLLLLGYFKYVHFFLSTFNRIADAHLEWIEITLPLGISFFTFTQVAYLVDVHRGVARETSFAHYLLFVTWFPHLIAGPVLHHRKMMPQFVCPGTYKPNFDAMAVGLTFFSIGLFKKSLLADQFAIHADAGFNSVVAGHTMMFFEAWMCATSYTLQLYFDFSGYADMAIGLSLLFNIRLPISFASPYKAGNIIEFWRRWNMTLSDFLRDYLYVPLGGNRKGLIRRYVNLLATMLLGGLWHGAGWNFVFWGGLHGVFLVINHGWRKWRAGTTAPRKRWSHAAGVLLTFAVVVIAWVPFRAPNTEVTTAIWQGMSGFNGFEALWMLWPLPSMPFMEQEIKLLIGMMIVWTMPNTQQWIGRMVPDGYDPDSNVSLRMSQSQSQSKIKWFAVICGLLFAFSVLSFNKYSPFLYYQF